MTTTNESDNVRSPFYKATRRVLLAGIGAFVLAQEEVEHFIDHLVEHGELAENEARDIAKDMRVKRKDILQRIKGSGQREKKYASKADIETLTAHIAELTAQVEAMQGSKKSK